MSILSTLPRNGRSMPLIGGRGRTATKSKLDPNPKIQKTLVAEGFLTVLSSFLDLNPDPQHLLSAFLAILPEEFEQKLKSISASKYLRISTQQPT